MFDIIPTTGMVKAIIHHNEGKFVKNILTDIIPAIEIRSMSLQNCRFSCVLMIKYMSPKVDISMTCNRAPWSKRLVDML